MTTLLFRVCVLVTLCGIFLFAIVSSSSIAQVIRQVTDDKSDHSYVQSIDDAGTLAVGSLCSDPIGASQDYACQIVKWELPGGARSQVTNFPGGVGRGWASASITDDGQVIAFASRADLLGQNPDLGRELFLIQSDGTGLIQLTDDATLGGGEAYLPVISGSGNRVLFDGTIDPHGTNPPHGQQLFVIDTDTLAVTQLTSGLFSTSIRSKSISDDGEHIVFDSSDDLTGGNPDGYYEVFKVDADGSDLTQLTTTTDDDSHYSMIAGNGNVLVFESADQVFLMSYAGTGQVALAAGHYPSVTDDGMWIYFTADDASGDSQIFKVFRTGGTPTQLTGTSDPISYENIYVSGSDSRVVFSYQGGEYPGTVNPDGCTKTLVMDTDGTNVQSLTNNMPSIKAMEPEITADGTRIVYTLEHLTGAGDCTFTTDVFRIEADGSDLTQLTTNAEAWHPSITADGETITFMSREDLTGEDPCDSNYDIFRIQDNGTGLAQLTYYDSCYSASSIHPVVAADGNLVIFQSWGSFDGMNADGGAELFALPLPVGEMTQIVDDDDDSFYPYKRAVVSADGVWAAWNSASAFDGANPNEMLQIFRGRTDGTLVEMVTTDQDYNSIRPDISEDGQLIVYTSDADPLGTNADHNREIFLYEVASETTQQLTTTTGSFSAMDPKISGDGQMVYFLSTYEFFGPEPGGIYRVSVATGTIERAGGTAHPLNASWQMKPYLATATDSDLLVFIDSGGPTGTNPDGSREIWLVDFGSQAALQPSSAAPTVIEWDPDPRAVRYDVIRGDVANLQPGAGGTVDLGTVVCLENDSVDTNTIGHEDAEQPASGQVFFLLIRGTQGILDGPGSYGQGTGGLERTPAAGDCEL